MTLEDKDAASGLSEDISRLEAEIEELAAERARVRALAEEYLKKENPADGVFHHVEIFELKQDSLRLEVEIEMRRKKINRIRLGEFPGLFA